MHAVGLCTVQCGVCCAVRLCGSSTRLRSPKSEPRWDVKRRFDRLLSHGEGPIDRWTLSSEELVGFAVGKQKFPRPKQNLVRNATFFLHSRGTSKVENYTFYSWR